MFILLFNKKNEPVPLQLYKQEVDEAIRDSVSGNAEDAFLSLGMHRLYLCIYLPVVVLLFMTESRTCNS